jgi:pyruvate kinase
MLQSMVSSPTPTRAEVSDVANAVFDAADAVMLSAETSVGKYPVQAVEMLECVAQETEAYDQTRLPRLEINVADAGVAASVAGSICTVAGQIDARAVVVWSETGYLARLVGKHRLDRPVFALTPSQPMRRRIAMYYGVIPVEVAKPQNPNQMIELADRALVEGGRAVPGDLVVLGFGPGSLTEGNTGAIIIHTIGG